MQRPPPTAKVLNSMRNHEVIIYRLFHFIYHNITILMPLLFLCHYNNSLTFCFGIVYFRSERRIVRVHLFCPLPDCGECRLIRTLLRSPFAAYILASPGICGQGYACFHDTYTSSGVVALHFDFKPSSVGWSDRV